MAATRIIIVFAGRFPSEKAAGLFVDLNARSLVASGADVTVLAPRRFGRGPSPETPYHVVYVPTVDLSRVPLVARFANYVTVAIFSLCALFWIIRNSSSDDVIISNDAFPLIILSVVRKRLMYEMHDFADRSLPMYRFLFSRVQWILATNEWKRNRLINEFGVPSTTILVERNAVDVTQFGQLDKSSARLQVGMKEKERAVVYTGHLYEWKGVTTLARAAVAMPETSFFFVGGTESDVKTFRAQWSRYSNIHIVGQVPHERVAAWQSAADVLVLPNSGKHEISVHYTSPMKLFEYMASERPVVASDLPSIREILPRDVGYFAEADNAASFAKVIQRALSDGDSAARSCRGREVVFQYSWSARAKRILQVIV